MAKNPSAKANMPLATIALVAASSFVFLAMFQSGNLSMLLQPSWYIEYGAIEPTRVWQGEIWRLLSAIFVHASLLHVLFNCMVLWQVGKPVELILGPSRFVAIFLLSGAAGFAASMLVQNRISMGSSGAVFGIVGAMIAILLLGRGHFFERRMLRALFIFVGINLGIGLISYLYLDGALDNTSHLVGLAAGFAFGVGFHFESQRRERAAMTIYASGFAVVAVLVISAIRPVWMPHYQLYAAESGQIASQQLSGSLMQIFDARQIAREGKDAEAIAMFQGVLGAHKYSQVLQLGRAAGDDTALMFSDERASSALCKAYVQSAQAQDGYVLNNCAWLWLMAREANVRDGKLGLTWAKRALALLPKSLEVQHTYAEALLQSGDLEEARHLLERAMQHDSARANKELHALQLRLAKRQHETSVQ